MPKVTKSDVPNEKTVATAGYSLRSSRMLPYPKPDISGTRKEEAQELVGANANPEELQLLEKKSDIESRNDSHFALSDTTEQQHRRVKLEMKVQKLRRNTIELWGRGDRYKLFLKRALGRWKESLEKERERTKCAKEAELDAQAEKAEVEEELREMEERAERAEELAEEVERAAKMDRDEMAEELREMEERAERAEELAEEAERAAKMDRDEMAEELMAAEERAGRAEAEKANIEARLREAMEQTRLAAEEERFAKSAKADMKELWSNAVQHISRMEETKRAASAEMKEVKEGLRRVEERAERAEEAERAARAEKAEVEEELRKAEERVKAESTELAKRTKEAEENAAQTYSKMMRYWRALTKEKRQVQLLQEELASGEPPAGYAQGPEYCDPLPDSP